MGKFDRIILLATESFLRNLRQRLLIILLIAVVPVIGLIFYQAKLARDVGIAEAQEKAWQIAENVAAREARFIDSARQLLTLLADTPEVMSSETAACGKLLRRFTGHNDIYVDLGVAGGDGVVRCAANENKVGTSIARTSHFQHALAAKGFAIGNYALRGARDRKSVGFALPIFSADGGVAAIVYAALDVAWINQLAAESHLPDEVGLSVVDARGTLLARFPDPEKWVGKHIPDAPMFEMLRLRSQANPHLVGLDGVERMYALKPLAPGPGAGQMYVMVGIPKAAAFGPVNRALAHNLTWIVLMSLGAGALAWLVGSKFVVGYVKVRVQAEEERARLAAIVESSEDAIIGMTLDGIVTSWNDGAETTYGFSAPEIVGSSIFRLVPTNHHDEVSELLGFVKQGRGINRYESKRKRKDGQVFDVSATLSPIRDVHRKVVGAATITRDITLLRKGEEQLLAYTDQLEALNLVSQEIAETLSVEQVIERGLNRLISAVGFDFASLHFSQSIGGRGFYGLAAKPRPLGEIEAFWAQLGESFEQCFWQCKSAWFVEDVKAAPEFAGAGGAIRSLAVLPLRQEAQPRAAITIMKFESHSFDADERRFLQAMSRQIALAVENARLYSASIQANEEMLREIEERKRAEQTLADFTAMVAHDLRSPLSNVVTIIDSIRDGLFGPINEMQQKWLWKVQASCKSLIGHVSDFLDISKIDAGQLQLTKAPVDLRALLNEGFVEHSVDADKKKIAFSVDVSDDLPRLFVDVRRVGQVLENLLSNAFKFTPSGGEISIAARAWGDAEVVWWVKDSGVGIPHEEFDHIFDKYRQVSGGQNSSHSGTGLGLAICKKIIEAHGGRIWVESEEGKGSTFFVSLCVESAGGKYSASI
jgi:PAS domain S-box-containing protein